MVISQNKIDTITSYFATQSRLSFTGKELSKIFEKEKKDWAFRKSISAERLLEAFLKGGFFSSRPFQDQNGESSTIYYFDTSDELTIVSAISPRGYFSYHTSIKLHGLTASKSSTYFLTNERNVYEEERDEEDLSQDAIDESFSMSQRESRNISVYNRKKVMLTSGKRLDGLGVVHAQARGVNYRYTDLERTLLDAVVRPAYSGGSESILKAFKKAKKKIDLLKLNDYLGKVQYVYPYHQSIGYYLKQAGYSKKQCAIFKKKIRYSFYLDYGARSSEFDEEWQIYHDL